MSQFTVLCLFILYFGMHNKNWVYKAPVISESATRARIQKQSDASSSPLYQWRSPGILTWRLRICLSAHSGCRKLRDEEYVTGKYSAEGYMTSRRLSLYLHILFVIYRYLNSSSYFQACWRAILSLYWQR